MKRVLALLLATVTSAWASAPADYAKLDPCRKGALLRSGASGEAVTALQHALAAASAPTAATGTFDAATVAAVKSFQSSRKIAVDGVVGPQTMRALDAALGVAAAAPKLRRLTNAEVTPAITAAAVKILHDHGPDPIGTRVLFDVGGKHYAGVIELHYHPPGGALRPWGFHHGVSVFEVISP